MQYTQRRKENALHMISATTIKHRVDSQTGRSLRQEIPQRRLRLRPQLHYRRQQCFQGSANHGVRAMRLIGQTSAHSRLVMRVLLVERNLYVVEYMVMLVVFCGLYLNAMESSSN